MASLIDQLYQQELGRAPEAEGLNYWTNLLNSGWTADDLRAAINASPEAQIYDARQQQIGNAGPAMTSLPTLTPEIASNLMQRSMTTGVPTSEFDKYGGYDAVASLYNSNKGTYSLDELDPAFLDQMDNIIANTGVGNLSVLKMTGEPLTKAGRQAMIDNGISWTDADLKAMAIPYEGFLQAPKTTVPTNNAGVNGPQLLGVSNGGAEWPGSSSATSGGWNARQVVGASKGDLMGAGNANYNSSLIKSLRQNSITPISTNPGVQLATSPGDTQSNWTAPTGQGSSFNPQVFNPRAASPQEVNDYNAYSAYRSSAVGASQPYISLTDWINAGRPTGVASNPLSGIIGRNSSGTNQDNIDTPVYGG